MIVSLFWTILHRFLIYFALFALILILLWMKKRTKGNKTVQIPSVSTLSYFKNILSLLKNKQDDLFGVYLLQYLSSACTIYLKKKLFKFTWSGYTYVVFFHPEVAQEILRSYNLINKDSFYNIFHCWLGTGLLTSSDEKWRSRRKLLTPAFHFRILDEFQETFNDQSNVLVEKLKKVKKDETIDIFELVTFCTLDIVGNSAMGVQINAQVQSDNDYVKAVKNITHLFIDWFARPWYWFPPILYFGPLGKKIRKETQVLHNFTINVIKNRKEKIIEELEDNQTIDNFQEDREVLGIKKRRAFLDLLLYHHLTDESLSENDIREEVDTFMFEGHDTTAMGISWTLYLLGLHQDIQNKVYQELQEIFEDDKNRTIKIEDLKEMKYLECVIKESLRLYPSVPIILRKNSEERKIGEYTIPRNASIIIFIYGIHHNPEVYENPEKFDPDRFLQENCENRHPFAYLPFSAGPRNCIGQRFAMMVLKTVCANVLRNFKVVSLQQRDQIQVADDVILRPKEEIKMLVKNR